MTTSHDILWLESFLKLCSPRGEPFSVREPFQEDEATWFRKAMEQGLFLTRECLPSCPRRKKRNESGPDEFVAAYGRSDLRHLFSLSSPVTLNREYIPHVAAVGRLVVGEGYNQACSSFSLYRQFTRDLIHKKKGGSYETDAEFYDHNGGIWLHVEVKKSEKEISAVAASIGARGSLLDLRDKFAKELEYVLDLVPRYLWLVGPGSVDPASYVYEVKVNGLSASLCRMNRLPGPPP